jgi:hypothetical protein
MPRLKGPAEFIEARRHHALRLLGEGFPRNEFGRILDVVPSSVMHWRDGHESGGVQALKVQFSPGSTGHVDRSAASQARQASAQGSDGQRL